MPCLRGSLLCLLELPFQLKLALPAGSQLSTQLQCAALPGGICQLSRVPAAVQLGNGDACACQALCCSSGGGLSRGRSTTSGVQQTAVGHQQADLQLMLVLPAWGPLLCLSAAADQQQLSPHHLQQWVSCRPLPMSDGLAHSTQAHEIKVPHLPEYCGSCSPSPACFLHTPPLQHACC